jgi:hypothetical protein
LRDGDTWRSHDRIALINRRENTISIVAFHISNDAIVFERILEMPSEDKARAYLVTEGFDRTNSKIEMADSAKPIPKDTVHVHHTVVPGQVWQNGRVVVSVQQNTDGLNLVEFEINGRRLKFRDAKLFTDESKAAHYIENLNCGLTDKVLVAASEASSVL